MSQRYRGLTLLNSCPVFIGLGSNLDDPEQRLRQAVAALNEAPEIRDIRVSSFRWTAPMGPVLDQPRFLNGVVMGTTTSGPRTIFRRLQGIEISMGLERENKQYQGPRRIDLDLLFVGSTVIDEATLTLPHPRLTDRRFVLEPIMELAPDFRHPVTGLTMREHFTQLESAEWAPT